MIFLKFYQYLWVLPKQLLVKLTNAYCTFVNGGKKVTPIFIDRIQDRRGKTIFNADKRKCVGCEEISYLKDEIPTIREVIENKLFLLKQLIKLLNDGRELLKEEQEEN